MMQAKIVNWWNIIVKRWTSVGEDRISPARVTSRCTGHSLNPTACYFPGVLLTAVCLITEMCERSPDTLTHFRKVRVRSRSKIFYFLKSKQPPTPRRQHRSSTSPVALSPVIKPAVYNLIHLDVDVSHVALYSMGMSSSSHSTHQSSKLQPVGRQIRPNLPIGGHFEKCGCHMVIIPIRCQYKNWPTPVEWAAISWREAERSTSNADD